jgi:hypothetical protein
MTPDRTRDQLAAAAALLAEYVCEAARALAGGGFLSRHQILREARSAYVLAEYHGRGHADAVKRYVDEVKAAAANYGQPPPPELLEAARALVLHEAHCLDRGQG